ncbi:MAG: tRNA 2-thiouridine(34) synthase MnmA, partial [Elusimicrobia bacterium]|nr:tRNA 2-thiouridine(34) synthase MnmA [Elusimicrobiota bacterium]
MTQPRVRVVVAMSGGVDSSVAAALVARAGYEAVGVTLRLLPKLETGFGCCGSPRDVEDAKRVCELLGISHYVLDIQELFEHEVIGPFIREYMRSRTPNPCVECNRNVKFGYLLGLARAWKAEYLATGHYARAEGGRLYRALDRGKDQSYFLYSLTRRELNNVLFPVGGLQKPEVRRIAQELSLPTADKPESQEIC